MPIYIHILPYTSVIEEEAVNLKFYTATLLASSTEYHNPHRLEHHATV